MTEAARISLRAYTEEIEAIVRETFALGVETGRPDDRSGGDGQAVVSLGAITARAREVVERHTQAFRVAREAALQERNKVVAALNKMFPAGTTPTAIAGWKDDWHGCVYIDLPTGQVSWHYHDRDADLFAHLPPYHGSWDGHDTPEKYRRLADLKAR